MILFFSEIKLCSISENVEFLKTNSSSTADADLKEVWLSTLVAREEEFAENKKLAKLDYYLTFKCFESNYGLSLVS